MLLGTLFGPGWTRQHQIRAPSFWHPTSPLKTPNPTACAQWGMQSKDATGQEARQALSERRSARQGVSVLAASSSGFQSLRPNLVGPVHELLFPDAMMQCSWWRDLLRFVFPSYFSGSHGLPARFCVQGLRNQGLLVEVVRFRVQRQCGPSMPKSIMRANPSIQLTKSVLKPSIPSLVQSHVRTVLGMFDLRW